MSLGAVDAALSGYQHIAVELEEKFHRLALDNIAWWQQRFGHLPQWVTPLALQGDSRHLPTVLATARLFDACVASPPYGNGTVHDKGQDATEFRHTGTNGYCWGTTANGHFATEAYSPSPQNLGNLPTGALDAAITSPPYATSDQNYAAGWSRIDRDKAVHQRRTSQMDAVYGATPGQLGNGTGDTFWSAARQIVAHLFALLKPGGHAIWVVKSYVRDGQIVDFPGQWRRLCESLGFETLHEHHALLVEEYGTQGGLFGEDTIHRTERKSFFRRLSERKGAPKIDYEVVFCMVKPAHATPLPPDTAWQQCELVLSSPPYAGNEKSDYRLSPDGKTRQRDLKRRYKQGHGCFRGNETYGQSPGQLGAMREGSLDAYISSPPYAGKGEVLGTHNGIDWTKTTGTGQTLTPGRTMARYSTSPDNLCNLPEGRHP